MANGEDFKGIFSRGGSEDVIVDEYTSSNGSDYVTRGEETVGDRYVSKDYSTRTQLPGPSARVPKSGASWLNDKDAYRSWVVEVRHNNPDTETETQQKAEEPDLDSAREGEIPAGRLGIFYPRPELSDEAQRQREEGRDQEEK